MSIRSKLYDVLRRGSNAGVRRWFKQQKWFFPMAQALFGSDVYSKSYYEDVERIERGSVGYIAQWVKRHVKPQRLVDLGCGPGHMMEAFSQQAIEVFGVDISKSALTIVEKRGLKAVRFDLTVPDNEIPGAPYDLAVSCEVAEHLEEKHASTFVHHLCNAADIVYLTAAEPDTGAGPGMMHFNEQPNAYWIELFAHKGFALDMQLTLAAREFYRQKGVISYLAKPMIFKRSTLGKQIS